MSLLEQLPAPSELIAKLKEAILGEKNSRLYALLDRYYSLRVEKRPKYIFYSIITLATALIVILVFYFIGLQGLQSDLSNAILNAQKLSDLKYQYSLVNQDFNRITTDLQNVNQSDSIVSALSQKNQEMGLETSSLPSSPVLIDLQNTDPLYSKFQIARIEYKLLNVSLKQTIDYINALQKTPNKFRVRKLEIHQKFNTKLYFDVDLTVEAYVPSASKNKE